MMGHLGPDSLAAGALASNLYMAFLIFGIGVMAAVAPMVAIELGRNRLSVRDVRRTVRQGFWVAATMAGPMWLCLWQAEAILTAMGQNPALAKAAASYLHTLQWGLLPFYFYLALRGFLAALQRPFWVFVTVLFAVVFNAFANWVLMFGRLGFPALGLPGSKLRLVTPPDSGGSFGIKSAVFAYVVLMGLASRKLGVPVRWIEDRLEHLAGSSSASGRVTHVEAGFSADGELLALRYDAIEDVGAYVRAPEPATLYRMHGSLNGAYRVEHVAARNRVVLTNTLPSGLNRGFGGPQLYLALERISRSPWGRVQRAVRDEENSAAMNGKNVTYRRIESFVLGAFIMGIGGAIYAHYVVSIDYSHFNPLFATFIVWVMLMLGGSGNNKGAILGAFVVWGVWTGTAFLVEAVTPALRVISDDLPSRGAYLRWMLVAILLAAIVLYRPQGLIRERSRVSDFMPEEESRD